VLTGASPSPDVIERVTDDLRRLVAGFRVRVGGEDRLRGDAHSALASALTRLESVEGLSMALCEAARAAVDRPTALVLRDGIAAGARVVAVSRTSDTRLTGNRVTADSAAGRAMLSAVPVVGLTLRELLGDVPGDRRRREEPGIAFPLHDGRQGIGALVVFGPPTTLQPVLRDHLAALAIELTPHIGAAAAIRAAESRAMIDELTGLPNRRGLERAMAQGGERPAALLMVDADHFKRLNDSFGHAAGDAALRHMAQIFLRTLREGDLATRIGGEEFALWLDGARGPTAHDVAERVRRATQESTLHWAGAEVKLTCSIGVACFPEPIRQIASLGPAADAALYRAKEGGRNRVEVAAR
jgi:diguanylate cyclase (GGDEF)-like protein